MKKLLIALIVVFFIVQPVESQSRDWGDIAEKGNTFLKQQVIRVHQNIYLFKISALEDGLVYHCALIGVQYPESFLNILSKHIKHQYCNSKHMKIFKDEGATLRYIYYNENSDIVGVINCGRGICLNSI